MTHRIWFAAENLAKNTSLRAKLFVLFSVLLLLPFGVFAFYTTNRISETLRTQTLSAAYKAFHDTVVAVSARAKNASDVISLLVYNDAVYRIAQPDAPDYSFVHQLEDSRSLSVEFENLEVLTGISRIRLYIDTDVISYGKGQILQSLEDISALPRFSLFNEQNTHLWFSPRDFVESEDATFSCMRMLYHPRAINTPLAVLRVDVSYRDMLDALHGSSVTEQGMVLLTDENDVLLSDGGTRSLSLSSVDISAITGQPADDWQEAEIHGESCFVYYTEVDDTGWYLVAVIPEEEIISPGVRLRNEMLLIAGLLVLVALSFAVIISNLLTRRMRALSGRMQMVEEGRMNVRPLTPSKDEVGQLIEHFNRMMVNLQHLMEEQVRQGMEIKNLELRALQAQINPHFLYNTLDTIHSLAFETDSPKIREMVSALASFYRISLSKGSDRIPIRDEIAHAKAYVEIQNIRFTGQVCVSWRIEREIEEQSIIKIVLQPLIENAMIHGIFEKEASCGTIIVSGKREDGDILISVEDDGVGMRQEEVSRYFMSYDDNGSSRGGYGIRNINERLHLAYGECYGLSCISTPGKGTIVTIRIPFENSAG
ncbi:MAG: sensor histidine kinase [Lachnospiraceae bacterium]|nr:sensor histidine kinase [Lachnospiraceae bacterium]